MNEQAGQGTTFVDLANLNDIPDQVMLKNGSEHELRVISAKIGYTKPESKVPNQPYLMVSFVATDVEDCRPFNHVMMLPVPGLEQEDFNNRGRQLRAFFQSAQFDWTGFDIINQAESLKDLPLRAVVKVDPPRDGYDESNGISRFL